MFSLRMKLLLNSWFVFVPLFLTSPAVSGLNDSLGLSNGLTSFTTPSLTLTIINDSQTAYSLRPKNESGIFDFIPYDVMEKRDSNGQYHLGDVTFRVRMAGSVEWTSGDSSQARAPVDALSVIGSTLAAANLSHTLPRNALIDIVRRWSVDQGHLQLLFDVKNVQSSVIEIGALGAALEFNNVNFILSFLCRASSQMWINIRFSRTELSQI